MNSDPILFIDRGLKMCVLLTIFIKNQCQFVLNLKPPTAQIELILAISLTVISQLKHRKKNN